MSCTITAGRVWEAQHPSSPPPGEILSLQHSQLQLGPGLGQFAPTPWTRRVSQAWGIILSVLLRGVQPVGPQDGAQGTPAPVCHSEMVRDGTRHFQRTGWGCCLSATDLRGFLCTLPQAGEATEQELRLPRGSCAFPSSLSLPPGGSGGHLRAPDPAPWAPRAALSCQGRGMSGSAWPLPAAGAEE